MSTTRISASVDGDVGSVVPSPVSFSTRDFELGPARQGSFNQNKPRQRQIPPPDQLHHSTTTTILDFRLRN
jgi:hypothetical protein